GVIIEIKHHFIKDSNEKKLSQMIKIHTDQNVTKLLIKAFDVSRFQYLIAKNINREAQIHAKVDGKKVIISEATVRRDLKFEYEGGIGCLSNEVIFEQLPLMGLEKKRRSRTHGLKRLYKIGLSASLDSSTKEQSLDEEDASKLERNIADVDADAEPTLVNETIEDQGSITTAVTADTTTVVSIDDITLAQALVEIKT
nr:putative ribonuclease H-like domain-containing protein [Tanacetum cinerariifolium]